MSDSLKCAVCGMEMKYHGQTCSAGGQSELSPAPCSVADVEEALGVSSDKLRELIKPLVMMMHQKRLPFVTIKLNKGIATVSTVKPPNDKLTDRSANNP